MKIGHAVSEDFDSKYCDMSFLYIRRLNKNTTQMMRGINQTNKTKGF